MEAVLVLGVAMLAVLLGAWFVRSRENDETPPPFKAYGADEEDDDVDDDSHGLSGEGFYVNLVGEQFDNSDGVSRQSLIARCQLGDDVSFVREPANRYDKNAILVTCRGGGIGMLPRECAKAVTEWLKADRSRHLSGFIKAIRRGGEFANVGIAIGFDIEREEMEGVSLDRLEDNIG